MSFFLVPYSGEYLARRGCCVIGATSGSVYDFNIPHEYEIFVGDCVLDASPSDVGSYKRIYFGTCGTYGYLPLTEEQCAEAQVPVDQDWYDAGVQVYPPVEGPDGCTKDGWVEPRARTVDHCVGCLCWDHGQTPVTGGEAPGPFTTNCDLFYGIQDPDMCEQAGAPCVGISGEVEHFEGRCGVQLTEDQCGAAAFDLGYDPLEYVLKHASGECSGSEIKTASDRCLA